jgi:Protein of unknown function (DUF4235)
VKIVFTPISIVLGLVAGIIGQKIFEKLWGLIDDQEPPSPEHREFSWPKLVAVLLVEGAIFRFGQRPDRPRRPPHLRKGHRSLAGRGSPSRGIAQVDLCAATQTAPP